MQFRDFWASLPRADKLNFASIVGASLGHLSNVAYGFREPNAALARLIESATNGAVMRWDLRPHDWHLIWPELTAHPAAPQRNASEQKEEA